MAAAASATRHKPTNAPHPLAELQKAVEIPRRYRRGYSVRYNMANDERNLRVSSLKSIFGEGVTADEQNRTPSTTQVAISRQMPRGGDRLPTSERQITRDGHRHISRRGHQAADEPAEFNEISEEFKEIIKPRFAEQKKIAHGRDRAAEKIADAD